MKLKFPLRLGRILIVLALIVALLGSSIPVPARAVGAGVLYNIAANIGVNLALRAIGVGPGNSPSVFNNLVTTIGEAVSSATAPLAQLLITGSSGNFRSFLSADFLSWILSWLFDSGTLTNSIDFLPDKYHAAYDSALSNFISSFGYSPFVCICYMNNSTWPYRIYFGPYPFSYDASRGRIVCLNGSTRESFKRYDISSSGSVSPSDGITTQEWPGDSYVFFYSGSGVSTTEDLALDSVDTSLSGSSYTGWVGQSVSNDDQAFLPVSVPSLDSSAISAQTQTQAQAGTIPDAVVDEVIAGAEVDPDVVTLSDIFTAIRSLGSDVVEAIQAVPAAIAAFFEPPTIYDSDGNVLPAYHVSLKDFFPFCLPFDIYDLISALAADPVAPVFEWTIAVPRWGISHDIKVDLSEWDDIARLFRTFELAGFVLGLSLITREKFLRS